MTSEGARPPDAAAESGVRAASTHKPLRARDVILWGSVTPLFLLMGVLAVQRPAAPAQSEASRSTSASPRIEPPVTRRILLLILDAWRRKTALDDSRMPRMAEFARRGSRGPVLSGVRTFTKACVREMMTGQRSSLSDSTRNLVTDAATGQSLFTRMIEAHMSFTLIDAFEALRGLFAAQSPSSAIRQVSVAGLPWDPLDPAHDAAVEQAGSEALRDLQQRLVVIHLESVDLAGHVYSPYTPRYEAVVRATDERVARLAHQLDLSRDTLYVIGDHGSDDKGHHGGPDEEARETAYLALGVGVRPGSASLDPLDIAATLAALLGLCPPEQSIGAPEADLLAIDGAVLKARCDACLRDRLAAAGIAGSASAEGKRYFAVATYTPQAAALYKQLVAARHSEQRPLASILVAGLALVVGLSLLRQYAAPHGVAAAWGIPFVILLLAVSTERDSVALVLYAATLLILASYELTVRSGIAVASTLLLLVGATVAFPAADSGQISRVIGQGVLMVAAVVLGARAFSHSRVGRLAPLVLTSVAAAAAAPLVPSDRINGHFSWGLTLVDYALATGILFLLVGLIFREDAVTGLAALALAACFFRGRPLAIFALLSMFPILAPKRLRRASYLPAALWAPLGVLALLRAQNGGYGFSRIDLSLFVLGINWVGKPNYVWGAAVILLSYLLPLILAAVLGQRFRGIAHASLGAIVAAFLLFAGVDLLFLALPGGSFLRVARLEEVFVFDVVFGLLALLVLAVGHANGLLQRAAIAKARAGDAQPGSAEASR
ncbi:MAG: alkaline phosphatase family protein [Acidobacteriota bacterium]